jgi:hypothetical protein
LFQGNRENKKRGKEKMFDYEVWYEGNCHREESGFDSFEETIEDAWMTIQEYVEMWEDDCELEEFIVKIDSSEYNGEEVRELYEEMN